MRGRGVQVLVRVEAGVAAAVSAAVHLRYAAGMRRLRSAHLLHVLRQPPGAARAGSARRRRARWAVDNSTTQLRQGEAT